MSMAGTMGSGVATFQGTPLVLGQCAPDAGVLTGIHGPTQTAVNDFATSAAGRGLSIWRRAGPVVPTGKNSSPSSSRQAPRSRQVIGIRVLGSKCPGDGGSQELPLLGWFDA